MLTTVGIYIVLHLAAYLIIFRHRIRSREKAMLFYHAVPHLAFVLFLLADMVRAADVSTESFIGVTSILGIYAVTVLDIWSLADRSYSVAILRAVVSNGAKEAVFRELAERGNTIKEARSLSLVRLGLLMRTDEGLCLTCAGRVVAFAFLSVRRLANVRDLPQ